MAAPDLWRTAVHGLVPALAEVPDAELLRRFHASRDEAAFELLVYRHGPLIWAACRRMLRDHHAAEDAFQATFLALARQAGSIRGGRSVPGWLHRVAVRAGIHLRRRNRRTQLPLGDDVIDPARGPTEAADDRETAAHIDAAINALSDRLRQVFILCELHGYSLADAAARLGVPIGTVASRLGRARERLRKVLSARGLAVGSGLLTADVVPPAVRGASVRAAAGGAKVTPMVMALSRRAAGPTMRAPMFGLACSIAAGLIGVALALGGPQPPPVAPKPAAKEPPPTVAVRKDADGDSLPDGAVARLGSARFRHGGAGISVAAFSADGRQLAAGDAEGVNVWDSATGRRVWHFTLPDPWSPHVMRFLDGGSRLAVGSSDWRKEAAVAVYDLTSGKVVDRTPFRGKNQTFIGDITPDGSRVLVNAQGDKVYLWDRKAGKEVWSVPTPDSSFALPFTADLKRVALARTFGATLRDSATGEVVGKFPLPAKPFWNGDTAALAPDGRLAVCSDAVTDNVTVGVYEAGRPIPVHTFQSEQRTTRLFFSPDSLYLVGPGEAMTRIWDLKAPAGKELVARLPGTTGSPSGTAGVFTADGKTLALDVLGGVSLWRVGEWTRLPQSADPPSGVDCVRFAADGKRVYGHTVGGWMAWPAGGGPGERLSDDSELDPRGRADISADGRVAADVLYKPPAGGKPDEYTLRVTDLRTGKDRRFPIPADGWRPVVVSDDGRFVIRAGSKEVTAWNATTGEVVYRKGHAVGERFPHTVQLTADGRGLRWSLGILFPPPDDRGPGVVPKAAFVTDHSTSREWKMDPAPFRVSSDGRFSPDGTRLAVRASFGPMTADGAVSVWDTATGRRLCAVSSVSGYRHTFALSADGRALLVGSNDETVRCVEVATGGERAAFRHAGLILSVAFHPDGTKATSSSPEAPVYIWDLLGDPGRWDPAKADAVWADLTSPDAKTAYAAIRKLRANPMEAVTFLKDRVKVPAVPADDTIAAWLKALDAPAFAEREKAQRELTAVAGLIRPKLEAARKSASAEAGRRLDQVLKALDEQVTPDGLRQIRACEVLEGARSPDAIRLLKV
jgi:RNA polymerase sigma factor (sigma-70 family)